MDATFHARSAIRTLTLPGEVRGEDIHDQSELAAFYLSRAGYAGLAFAHRRRDWRPRL